MLIYVCFWGLLIFIVEYQVDSFSMQICVNFFFFFQNSTKTFLQLCGLKTKNTKRNRKVTIWLPVTTHCDLVILFTFLYIFTSNPLPAINTFLFSPVCLFPAALPNPNRVSKKRLLLFYLCLPACLSVCLSAPQNNMAPNNRIFTKYNTWIPFKIRPGNSCFINI